MRRHQVIADWIDEFDHHVTVFFATTGKNLVNLSQIPTDCDYGSMKPAGFSDERKAVDIGDVPVGVLKSESQILDDLIPLGSGDVPSRGQSLSTEFFKIRRHGAVRGGTRNSNDLIILRSQDASLLHL
jgi:hypothetical protein